MVHIYGGWRCCKLEGGIKQQYTLSEIGWKVHLNGGLGILLEFSAFFVFVFLAFMINLSVISYFHQLVKIIFNVIIIIIIAPTERGV